MRTFTTYPEDCLDGWGDLEDAKRAFFRKGDVIATQTAHGPRRALIVFVDRECSDRTGDWIPRYRVRVARADGTWSKAWQYAWPGQIERGLAALQESEHADQQE